MKNTIARGEEAELLVTLQAIKLGLTISSPINHSSQYDLIIDSNGKLNRVQVKRAFTVNSHGYKRICVETRRMTVSHSGTKIGCVTKKYCDDGYDFLIAVDCDNNNFWVIPREETIKHAAQIYLGNAKKEFLNNWESIVDM